MNMNQIVDQLAVSLEESIRDLPDGFYDTFDYTKTGNNLTHPVTLGILADILGQMAEVARVAIDWRVNQGQGIKMQPDIVALDADLTNPTPRLFIDYESPNSSDYRVLKKDMFRYLDWRKETASGVPYAIITTLPNRRSPRWKLLWTSIKRTQYNHAYHGRVEEVRDNPFAFWYTAYQQEMAKFLKLRKEPIRTPPGVYLLNISGKQVSVVMKPGESLVDPISLD